QRIGSIIYPTIITRPDASRTAQKLAEFMQNPSPAHEQAVNRCLAYLYQTKDCGLLYSYDRTNPQSVRTNLLKELQALIPTDIGAKGEVGGALQTETLKSSRTNENNSRTNGPSEQNKENNLQNDWPKQNVDCTKDINMFEEGVFRAASDASFADDTETRQSTEGYTFHLFNALIDWQSSKQRTVVRSTTEAELLALSRATTQLYWWLRVFDQIGLKTYEHPSIECDNAQTVRLMVTDAPKLMTKLRHIDIHQSWLRQEVQKGAVDVKWIPTRAMPADGFTKALPRQKHEEFMKMIGLVHVSKLESGTKGVGETLRTI
ncbi:hypothetical protein V500_10219, partial [Pseudogymnoascus sp. VKM F-4518 (FW-2643)]